MLYQVCVLNKATDKEKHTVKSTKVVEAKDIAQATAWAEQNHARAVVRVYPYCTAQDGDGQLKLARHTLNSVEKWERCNDNAALEPYKRTQEDRDDFIMCACVAFATIFAENPHADMHTLKTAAFAAIRAEQVRRARNSEREYLPGWDMCNITPRTAKATFPALDALTRKAAQTADMTENQARVLDMVYQDGKSAQNIADELNVKRATVYQTLYRAYYKVLAQMVELDNNLNVFMEAGYTGEDIDEILAILRRRARW